MSYKPDIEICDVVRADVKNDVAKAFQLPRLTTTQRNALGDIDAGGLIWNTTTAQVEIYDGDAWQSFTLA
jgi:hypothetical protein